MGEMKVGQIVTQQASRVHEGLNKVVYSLSVCCLKRTALVETPSIYLAARGKLEVISPQIQAKITYSFDAAPSCSRHVCMYVCMDVCMYACMHVCICMYLNMITRHTYVFVYAWELISMCVKYIHFMSIHTWVFVQT